MISALFRNDEVVSLTREQATKDNVLRTIKNGTHLHLALHGQADYLTSGGLSASLSLAGGELMQVEEVFQLGLSARVVVASACQTALLQGGHMTEEVLSLATAFLGAGAASVVASLWPVDDMATALLMSRFYEELLFGHSQDDPAGSLRSAQQWLRAVTTQEIEAYVRDRPKLQAAESVRRPGEARLGDRSLCKPYASPVYWAPFVAYGA